MALISCPDCGRQVSDKAAVCPDCGCPITSSPSLSQPTHSNGGDVAIKIGKLTPKNNALGNAMVKVRAFGPNDEPLGEGKIGTIIRFHIDKPTEICLKGALNLNYYKGPIKPNTRYELVMIPSLFLQKYALNEIDVIDSGW